MPPASKACMERGGTMGHDISSDVATYGQPATRWRGDVSVLGNVERSHRRSQIVGCSRFVVGCTSDRRAVSAVSSGHLANAGTRALNDRVEEFQFRPNNWRVAIVISAIGSVANQTRIIEYCVGVHHLPAGLPTLRKRDQCDAFVSHANRRLKRQPEPPSTHGSKAPAEMGFRLGAFYDVGSSSLG